MPLEKLTRQTLKGVWTALIVTWNAEDELDAARFSREVSASAGAGVHGVYTGGTTGEFYAQDDATFARISEIACREAHAHKVPIQIGCSALSTRVAKNRIAVANRLGADAIQIALPFWLALKEDEAAGFVEDIAQAAYPTPIVLYHTDRARFKFSPAQIAKLAEKIPTFIGMKDGGCDLPVLQEMLRLVPTLSIFGGEADLVTRMGLGGRGTYSSVVGLSPHGMLRLFELCETKRFSEAQILQKAMHDVIYDLALEWVKTDGLWDSALDRIFRRAGGGDVELRCQKPYRSGNESHVTQMRQWCLAHAPYLLDSKLPIPLGSR